MYTEHNLNVVRELGLFGLKTVLTLNAGAAIVLLTFLGTIISAETIRFPVSIDIVESAMVAFLIGIGFCLSAVAMNYVLAYGMAGDVPSFSTFSATDLFMMQVLPVLTSFAFFSVGVMVALSAVG